MSGTAARRPAPARPRPHRIRPAFVVVVAASLAVSGCGRSSEAASPSASPAPDAVAGTDASPGGATWTPGRRATEGALLAGAGTPQTSTAPIPASGADGGAAAADAAAAAAAGVDGVDLDGVGASGADGAGGVAALLASPGVEAVVATVVGQEGGILAWPEPPGPAGQAPPLASIPVRNEFGGPAQFRVQEQVGDWLRVQLPIRPNGSEGWIARAEVAIAPVMHRIEVDLGDRHLRVLQGGQVVLESPVAIGRPGAPTPTGSYYVRDSFAWDPYSVYGPYVLPLSAFSDSIEAINGGEAVVAIHGTNRPESVGRAASLGCLRLDNDTVTALAHLVPVGTPVLITA